MVAIHLVSTDLGWHYDTPRPCLSCEENTDKHIKQQPVKHTNPFIQEEEWVAVPRGRKRDRLLARSWVRVRLCWVPHSCCRWEKRFVNFIPFCFMVWWLNRIRPPWIPFQSGQTPHFKLKLGLWETGAEELLLLVVVRGCVRVCVCACMHMCVSCVRVCVWLKGSVSSACCNQSPHLCYNSPEPEISHNRRPSYLLQTLLWTSTVRWLYRSFASWEEASSFIPQWNVVHWARTPPLQKLPELTWETKWSPRAFIRAQGKSTHHAFLKSLTIL